MRRRWIEVDPFDTMDPSLGTVIDLGCEPLPRGAAGVVGLGLLATATIAALAALRVVG